MNDKISENESIQADIAMSREQQIRERAYELYLARQGGPGSAFEDWLQAEAEIVWKQAH
jgi:hypothetical protein